MSIHRIQIQPTLNKACGAKLKIPTLVDVPTMEESKCKTCYVVYAFLTTFAIGFGVATAIYKIIDKCD